MEKIFFVVVAWVLLSPNAFGETKPKVKDECHARVLKLIKDEATKKGLKEKIGIHLTRDPAGVDEQGRPLTAFNSGVFIVDDGYISDSYASVTVRASGKTCEILKYEVSIGKLGRKK